MTQRAAAMSAPSGTRSGSGLFAGLLRRARARRAHSLRRNILTSLDDRVAIVTGSGRGLGLAYARQPAAAGAAVVINDVDEQSARH